MQYTPKQDQLHPHQQQHPKRVYLDYNATTPVCPAAQQAIVSAMHQWGNPSSGYWVGREAHEAHTVSRKHTAHALGCNPEEVVFTSGGTESNVLAILGVLEALLPYPSHVVTTDIEHPAVMQVLKKKVEGRNGWTVTWLPTGPTGRVDAAAVSSAVTPDTRLVTVMHANNETGVLQPVREIVDVCASLNAGRPREERIYVHTDAAQSLGKVQASASHLGVDLLSVCGHKFYGPKGVGALYVKEGTPLVAQIPGAQQERGRRAGTETTYLAAGMAAALQVAVGNLAQRAHHMSSTRDLLLVRLQQHFEVEVNGDPKEEHRLPNTLNCSLKFRESGKYVDAQATVAALRDKVAMSTGSACSTGSGTITHNYKALGLTRERALAAIRMSTGVDTTDEEVEFAVKALVEAAVAQS